MNDAKQILAKIAPFMLRSRAVIVGRPRLLQMRKRLEFVLFTTDLSENSREKMTEQFQCPVIEALTSAEVEELFGFRNTKVLGFRRSDTSRQALKQFRAAGAVGNTQAGRQAAPHEPGTQQHRTGQADTGADDRSVNTRESDS